MVAAAVGSYVQLCPVWQPRYRVWRRVVECDAELSSVAQSCRVYRRMSVSAGTCCQPGRGVNGDVLQPGVSSQL